MKDELERQPTLSMEPIPQIAWWKQSNFSKSIKPTDKMPVAQIIMMYKEGCILCDSCGKKMKIEECQFSLLDHVLHFINEKSLWCCEGCYLEDKRKGKIIACGKDIDGI